MMALLSFAPTHLFTGGAILVEACFIHAWFEIASVSRTHITLFRFIYNYLIFSAVIFMLCTRSFFFPPTKKWVRGLQWTFDGFSVPTLSRVLHVIFMLCSSLRSIVDGTKYFLPRQLHSICSLECKYLECKHYNSEAAAVCMLFGMQVFVINVRSLQNSVVFIVMARPQWSHALHSNAVMVVPRAM